MQYFLIATLFLLGLLIFTIGFVSVDKTTRYFFLIFGILTLLFLLFFLDFPTQQKRSFLPARIIFHLSGDSNPTESPFLFKKIPVVPKIETTGFINLDIFNIRNLKNDLL